MFVSIHTLCIQVQFYHYYDFFIFPYKISKNRRLLKYVHTIMLHFVSISRFLHEQIGNQQVQMSFQNFSPENLSNLQNYNVSLYVMVLLTVV